MSHGYHEKPRRVLGDDCEECVGRATSGLNGLSQLDDTNLRLLADLAADMKADPYGAETPWSTFGASYADRKAVETLRLAARIVYRSGITEEDAR